MGSYCTTSSDGQRSVIVDVISSTYHHVELLKTVFDFHAIRALVNRKDFSLRYDCMHGVQGPYARAVLIDALGAPQNCLVNAVPKVSLNILVLYVQS